MRSGPRYSRSDAAAAVAESRSYAEALRRLGMCASGGNWRTLKRYVTEVWRIPVDHFDPHATSREALARHRWVEQPLDAILVEGSSFSRGQLKKRLYAAGLKAPRCELCGQGEWWRGRNGGPARSCANCGMPFTPCNAKQRYCSRRCGGLAKSSRRVERPPYEQLVAEVAATSYVAVGRKYGVSDNAIRRWLRQYERERAA